MNMIRKKIETLRNQQIVRSQDKLLKQFLFNKEYVNTMANHPLHASIGQWLPKKQGDTVLELGCGPGKYVAMLNTMGFKVTGVDPYSFPSWNIIRQETPTTLLDQVFAEKLPFKEHSFDHVVCLGALLYFNDPSKAIQEIKRVIKPGGKIIIRTVNKNNLYTLKTGKKPDPASKNLYTMQELIEFMVTQGLVVSKNFSYGFLPPFWTDFWWYLQCVWIPTPVLDFMSSRLLSENHVNITIFATSP